MTEAEELELLELEAEAANAGQTITVEPRQQDGMTFPTWAKPYAYVMEEQLKTHVPPAIAGAAQGVTLGHAPEIAAGLVSGVQEITKTPGEQVPGYGERLEEYRGLKEELKEQSPVSFTMGEMAGTSVLPIPGASAARGGSALIRGAKAVGKGALEGAAFGAAYNPELPPEATMLDEFSARAEQAKEGLGIGGAVGGVTGATREAVSAVAEPIKKYFAGKTMGLGGQAGKAEKLYKQGKLDKSIDFMEQEGMLGVKASPESTYYTSKKILDETGKDIGETYKKVSNDLSQGVSMETATPEDIKNFVNSQLSSKNIADEAVLNAKQQFDVGDIDVAELNAVKREANRLAKHGDDISELLRYRKSLDKRLEKIWKKPFVDMTEKEQALIAMRSLVKDKIDNHIQAIDRVSGGSNLELLKKLNERYSRASDIHDVAQKYYIKGKSKNLVGLPELIVGGSGAVAGGVSADDPISGIAKGASAGLLYGIGRKYGPGASYRGTQALQKKLEGSNKLPRTVVVPWLEMTREEQQ